MTIIRILSFLFIFYMSYETVKNIYTLFQSDEYMRNRFKYRFKENVEIDVIYKYLRWDTVTTASCLILWLILSVRYYISEPYATYLSSLQFVVTTVCVIGMVIKGKIELNNAPEISMLDDDKNNRDKTETDKEDDNDNK